MNILVPTDFSEVAKAAVRYAAMLAKKLDAKMFEATIHVIHISKDELSEKLQTRNKLKTLLHGPAMKR